MLPANGARLTWITALGDARCRHDHSMRYTVDEVVVDVGAVIAKVRGDLPNPIVRIWAHCETCARRHGAPTYQVGFSDKRDTRWFAVPSLAVFEDMRTWDIRVTESMTEELLRQMWRDLAA